MKKKAGFTLLELIIAITIVTGLLIVFILQKLNVDAMNRDAARKTSINAIYYALEEGFYEKNGFYPEHIDNANVLPYIDPNSFTDPNGVNLWDKGSNFEYAPTGCEDAKCKNYSLRSTMEKEDTYIKTSRR